LFSFSRIGFGVPPGASSICQATVFGQDGRPTSAIGLMSGAVGLFAAHAEDYPTHNVTILVPFAPGGGTDLLARAYAQILAISAVRATTINRHPLMITSPSVTRPRFCYRPIATVSLGTERTGPKRPYYRRRRVAIVKCVVFWYSTPGKSQLPEGTGICVRC
jgi:hypothetical protein